jgi:hypothetical protein
MNFKIKRKFFKRTKIFYSFLFCLTLIVYFSLKLLVGWKTSLKTDFNEIVEINSEQNNQNDYVTVISLYFSLNKSKHSIDEYDLWMNSMLRSVKSPLVLFTDKKSFHKIYSIRKQMNHKTTLVIYDNIWIVLKELEQKRNINYTFEYLFNQQAKDPERKSHNPNIYAIYTLKAFICDKITRSNPYESSFFIYTDIGAWRKGIYPDWPDLNFTSYVQNRLQDRILFGQIHNITNYTDPSRDIIQGTFYAGSARAIQVYANHFYEMHDKRLNDNKFVGKAETTMNAYLFESKEAKYNVVRLRTWNIKCYRQIDVWLYYQIFFSNDYDQICEEDRFKLLLD